MHEGRMTNAHTRPLRRGALAALLLLAAGVFPGCDRILPQREDTTLPPIEAVRATYAEHGVTGTISYSGNVVEIRVTQPRPQLERGGSLWARVGPYVYLFSPATRDVFAQHAGIAAVRVITATGDGTEVGRALLARDTFSPPAWQRTLNLLGLALRDGTERPTQLEALVDWGERYTTHQYNRDFVPRSGAR
jgi:hypothetical protein